MFGTGSFMAVRPIAYQKPLPNFALVPKSAVQAISSVCAKADYPEIRGTGHLEMGALVQPRPTAQTDWGHPA